MYLSVYLFCTHTYKTMMYTYTSTYIYIYIYGCPSGSFGRTLGPTNYPWKQPTTCPFTYSERRLLVMKKRQSFGKIQNIQYIKWLWD